MAHTQLVFLLRSTTITIQQPPLMELPTITHLFLDERRLLWAPMEPINTPAISALSTGQNLQECRAVWAPPVRLRQEREGGVR